MTDIEINELSIEVITSIAEDLRVAYYDKVGGTLTIEWGVEQSIRGHNRKRKLLYGRSHLSSKSSKILNVKNPRFLHSI